jgi:F420-non-reducing hydrogenase iron-sulfur subunit
MVADLLPNSKTGTAAVKPLFKAKLTVLHCYNALNEVIVPGNANYEIQSVKLPCSSMTREITFLKAFEGGSDAVIVLVCPVGTCRYFQGNLRTAKRVARVQKMLNDIGLDGRRLNLYNIPHGDQTKVQEIIQKTLSGLIELGPNPAK